MSALENGGSAVGRVALLLDVLRMSMDALELGDTELVALGDEVGGNDATVDVNSSTEDGDEDDGLEVVGSPAFPVSANKLMVSLQQLASPQHQLLSPHFLTGAFSSCHYVVSTSPTVIRDYTTYNALIADIAQALRTLPCWIGTPLSPPQLHALVRSIERFVILA